MFTKAELSLVQSKYFSVLRIDERSVVIQSRNTKHVWMIFKKVLDEEWPVVLHHKHRLSDPWFHEHKKVKTVSRAVGEIKKHDEYVLKYRMRKRHAGA
ncbi:MAG: hypothetical protein K6G24_11095 [Lachnospiraceae bacterium]|nr:hypothetical protein [Lachnospiraceae bacterium]